MRLLQGCRAWGTHGAELPFLKLREFGGAEPPFFEHILDWISS